MEYFDNHKDEIEKEYLKEVLDIKDSPEYDVIEKDGEYFKSFEVGEETFEMEITPSDIKPTIYLVSFKLLKSPNKEIPKYTGDIYQHLKNMERYEYDLTNSNNPIRILQIASSILYRFIKIHSPLGVVFGDYNEGTRNKVYHSIAIKVANKSGYILKPQKNPNHFAILKPS